MKGPEYLESRRKRVVEKTLAVGIVAVAAPVAAWLWVENKLQRQRLIFKQERVGQGAELFSMWKFETMYPGAELDPLHQELFHRAVDDRDDTRVKNRRMKFVRKVGLNELAQVVNIFKGEMNVFGPRPLPPEYLDEVGELYPDLLEEWKATALRAKPGLVGTSPLETRDLPVEEFPTTARVDIGYYENASLSQDLRLFAQTLQGVLRSSKKIKSKTGGIMPS